jgi:hypothetical protein
MGWEVSVTPRPRFIPGERTPGTHCTGGWVGPRAGLDTEVRGKILCLCRGSNLDSPVVQSVVRHYTDCTTKPVCTLWANEELGYKMLKQVEHTITIFLQRVNIWRTSNSVVQLTTDVFINIRYTIASTTYSFASSSPGDYQDNSLNCATASAFKILTLSPLINILAPWWYFKSPWRRVWIWQPYRMIYRPDDGSSKQLWKVGKLLRDYTAQYPWRLLSSYSPPWEPDISQCHGQYVRVL